MPEGTSNAEALRRLSRSNLVGEGLCILM
jgi:hypothetical protein